MNMTFAELQVKYNKLQRFRIKPKDVKAGLYVRFGQNSQGHVHYTHVNVIGKPFVENTKIMGKSHKVNYVWKGYRGDTITSQYHVNDLCV